MSSYSPYSDVSSIRSWTEEYKLVWDDFGIEPSNYDSYNQNEWTRKMVVEGYWDKAIFIHMFSTHDGGQLLNWKSPGTFNPSEINDPVFSAYRGYKGVNGSPASLINANFIPSSNAAPATSSDVCWMLGIGTNVLESAYDGGTADNSRWMAIRGNASSTFGTLINSDAATYQHKTAIAHYALSRNNNTLINIHRNHFYFTKSNNAPAALSTKAFYSCGYTTGAASTKEIRYSMMFSYLTPEEVSDIIKITEAYLLNYGTSLYDVKEDNHTLLQRISSKTLFRSDDSLLFLARPIIAENAIGQWLTAYIHATDHSTDDGLAVIDIRISDDQGETWSDKNKLTDGTPIINAPFVTQDINSNNLGVGLLITCPNNDLVMSIYEVGGVVGNYQWRSTDNGASWTAEGRVMGNDYLVVDNWTLVGNDIYTIARDYPTDAHLMLYKSTDNCASWIYVSDIQNTVTSEEAGVEYVGNNTFVVVMKSSTSHTYQYTSTDMGLTWVRTDILSSVGYLNKPILKKFDTNLYLIARYYQGSSTDDFTVVYVSEDNGVTWGGAFFPDQYGYSDTGYCGIMRRSNGDFYLLTYAGVTNAADIKEHIFKLRD